MPLKERLELYRELEAMRKRPLIVYVTNDRRGVESDIAADVLPEMMDQAEVLPQTEGIDLLVVSNGGDPTVAFRIITLLRERAQRLSVMIPQSAYSAATLLALGADEIIMHPNGNLGPVDPQIHIHTSDGSTRFAAEDVSAFLRFAREDVGLTDQKHLTALFQTLCSQVGSVPLGFSARASQLSVSLGEKLLRLHMREETDQQRAHAIAESLCKDFYDHGYAVSRAEARTIGLKVADSNTAVECIIWKIWCDFEAELNSRSKFSSIIELMNSPEGPKLASPVPQITVATGTPPDIEEEMYRNAARVEQISPIDVEIVTALVESSRLASRAVDTRKIIGTRTAELIIEFSSISVSSGWRKVQLA